MHFQSYFQSCWPEEVTGDRIKGHVAAEPDVVSVCRRCISAPLPGLALPPPSPGLLGSFAAPGWKMRATVERKERGGGDVGRVGRSLGQMRVLHSVFDQSCLTSTSPVSFSLRTKLSCSRSGPAINLRRRGRSCRGSFWNRSAHTIKMVQRQQQMRR